VAQDELEVTVGGLLEKVILKESSRKEHNKQFKKLRNAPKEAAHSKE
jgi:hypothetical protein